jgi:hypothetical protein
VRKRTLALAAVAAVAAAAPASGQSSGAGGDAPPALAVELRAERVGFTLPDAVSVRLTRPAHVAVFEVRPGVGSVLRYPDGRPGGRLGAGEHRLPLDAGRGAFDRRRGVSALPGRGRLSPDRPRDLGRPYLLAVASPDRLWLSGHRLGRVFRPRDVRLSVPFLVDAVLRDVVPHLEMEAWAFDVRPGVPVLGRRPFRGALPFPPPVPHGRAPHRHDVRASP